MTKSVELVFDFVSPNAYLVWRPLREICERHGAELTVTPVFLAGMHRLTGNAPPMIRDAEVKGKNEYAQLEIERFIATHGLERFAMHPQFPFNSIRLQRMLFAACEDERGIAFVDTLLPAIWEEGIDLADSEAIAAAIEAAGFDAAKLSQRAGTEAVKQGLVASTDDAVERGAFGIPSVFVPAGGGFKSLYFGKERLDQVERALSGQA